MFGIVIYVLVIIASLVQYFQKRYVSFIVLLSFLVGDGYFVISSGGVKPMDFYNIVVLTITAYHTLRGDHFFGSSHDKIGRWIKILLIYGFCCTILTIIRGQETPIYAFLVYRFDLFLLAYFIFRCIPIERIHRAMLIIIKISVFTGILYVLQNFGVSLLNNGVEEYSGDGIVRLSNFPFMVTAILFYLIVWGGGVKHRMWLILLFGVIIALIQSRGLMLSVGVAVVIFLIRLRGKKARNLVITIIAVMICLPVVEYRFNKNRVTGGGVLTEMKLSYEMIASGTYSKYYGSNVIYNQGTFVHRILYIAERISYLSQKPFSLVFGEGLVHESSQNIKRYRFIMGVYIPETGTIHQQIDTTDVSLISHVFRYGLIYLFIYAYIIYLMIRGSYRSDNKFLQVLFFVILIKLFQMLGADVFYNFPHMFYVLMISPLIFNNQKSDRCINSNSKL